MQLMQVPMIDGASYTVRPFLKMSPPSDGPQYAGVNPLSFARSEQRQVLWLHHSANHPSSQNAARIAACVSFCRAPRRASSNCFRTACHHGSSRKFISTCVSIKAPMSSNLLRTRSLPGALAFSLIGSKCSSAIGCKPRRPPFCATWRVNPLSFEADDSALNRRAVGAYSQDVRASAHFRGAEKSRIRLASRYSLA